MKYYMKIHEQADERLIAVCDSHLLGKTLTHNNVELIIQERFYGQIEVTLDEVIREIKNSTSYNVFGKQICEDLIEENLINPNIVLWIENGDEKVGHAIVVR